MTKSERQTIALAALELAKRARQLAEAAVTNSAEDLWHRMNVVNYEHHRLDSLLDKAE